MVCGVGGCWVGCAIHLPHDATANEPGTCTLLRDRSSFSPARVLTEPPAAPGQSITPTRSVVEREIRLAALHSAH